MIQLSYSCFFEFTSIKVFCCCSSSSSSYSTAFNSCYSNHYRVIVFLCSYYSCFNHQPHSFFYLNRNVWSMSFFLKLTVMPSLLADLCCLCYYFNGRLVMRELGVERGVRLVYPTSSLYHYLIVNSCNSISYFESLACFHLIASYFWLSGDDDFDYCILVL